MGFSRLLRNYGLATLGVAILIVALHIAAAPRGMHLTDAQLLVEASESYPPPPAQVDADALPGAWARITLPNASVPELETILTGTAAVLPTQTSWYRLVLPRAVLPAEADYLFIPRWKTDGELAVYVNGKLEYQSHANLLWNGSNRPLRLAFDNTEGAEPVREIVLRMQHLRGTGGALSSLWVGNFDEVGVPYLIRSFFQADLPYVGSAAFLICGFMALFVWSGQREERIYLLFFVLSVVAFIRVMHTYMGLERLPIPDAWFGWLTVNSLIWMLATVHVFMGAMHQQPSPRLTWLVGLTTMVLAIVTCPLFQGTFDPTLTSPIAYMVMFIIANLVAVVGLRAGWRAQSLEAFVLAGWVAIIAYLGVYDLLLQQNLVSIEGYFLLPYAQIAVVVGSFHAIIGRYTKAVGDVKQSNILLADRLAEREAELTASYEKMRAIEQRELIHEERQRLMEDMHDGLGSSLVSALRMAERGKLDETDMTQILQGCIDDLKLTIDSMEPVETDLLLLLGTLRFRLQPRLENTGIKLRWNVKDVPPMPWLNHRHALHILRILQEAFTNIIKHAEASEASVTTDVRGDEVFIGISDNGGGFDGAPRPPGRGLSNQVRRAKAIGGRTEVRSGPDGTSFHLFLPVRT